jgi:hypothetical protein
VIDGTGTTDGTINGTIDVCPDCGIGVRCPECNGLAINQLWDKTFWCRNAHGWKCVCRIRAVDVDGEISV